MILGPQKVYCKLNNVMNHILPHNFMHEEATKYSHPLTPRLACNETPGGAVKYSLPFKSRAKNLSPMRS